MERKEPESERRIQQIPRTNSNEIKIKWISNWNWCNIPPEIEETC